MASSSNTCNAVSVRLDEHNYHIWFFQMQHYLRSLGLLKFVDGTHLCPSPPLITPSAREEWFQQDSLIISMISNTISPDALTHIIGCQSSMEVWVTLKKRFATISVSHIMQLKFSLYHTQKGTDSVEKYLLRFKTIRDKLALVGVQISDEEIKFLILAGLPCEYGQTRQIIRSKDHISMEEVRSLLLSAEWEIQLGNSSPGRQWNSSFSFVSPFCVNHIDGMQNGYYYSGHNPYLLNGVEIQRLGVPQFASMAQAPQVLTQNCFMPSSFNGMNQLSSQVGYVPPMMTTNGRFMGVPSPGFQPTCSSGPVMCNGSQPTFMMGNANSVTDITSSNGFMPSPYIGISQTPSGFVPNNDDKASQSSYDIECNDYCTGFLSHEMDDFKEHSSAQAVGPCGITPLLIDSSQVVINRTELQDSISAASAIVIGDGMDDHKSKETRRTLEFQTLSGPALVNVSRSSKAMKSRVEASERSQKVTEAHEIDQACMAGPANYHRGLMPLKTSEAVFETITSSFISPKALSAASISTEPMSSSITTQTSLSPGLPNKMPVLNHYKNRHLINCRRASASTNFWRSSPLIPPG